MNCSIRFAVRSLVSCALALGLSNCVHDFSFLDSSANADAVIDGTMDIGTAPDAAMDGGTDVTAPPDAGVDSRPMPDASPDGPMGCSPGPDTDAGSWEPTSGIEGGSISTIAATDAAVVIGTQRSGAFRSTDHGASWSAVPGLGLMTVRAIVAIDSMTFLAGAGLADRNLNDLYISFDAGATWRSANLMNHLVQAIVVDLPYVYVGTDAGVFVSSDPTSTSPTWTPFSTGIGLSNIQAMGLDNSYVYAGVDDSGVLRTARHTTTAAWSLSGMGITDRHPRAFTFANNVLVLGTNNGGVFHSTDGANWSAMNVGMGSNPSVVALASHGSTVVAVNHTGLGVCVCDVTNCLWNCLNSSQHNFFSVAMDPTGSTIFAGAGGDGIYIGGTSGSLTRSNRGLFATEVHSLFLSGSRVFAMTNGNSIWESTDEGGSWTTNATLPNQLQYPSNMVSFGGNIYVGGYGIYQSGDGINWMPAGSGARNMSIATLAATDSTIYAIAPNMGLLNFDNSSTTWNMTASELAGRQILTLAASSADVYAGTNPGVFHAPSGGTFTAASTGLDPGDYPAILPIPGGSTVLAGGWVQGVFRSNDRGANWRLAGGASDFQGVIAFGDGHDELYAGTYSGAGGGGATVYISSYDGNCWRRFDNGLPQWSTAESFVRTANFVLAGTSTGVWRRRR
jgi:hypothetical protein